MKSIIITISTLFLLFNNIFINKIMKNIPLIEYWDEFILVTLIVLYVLKIARQYSNNGKIKILRLHFNIISLIFSVVIVGIIGNLIWKYAYSIESVVRDIVAFVKFPFTYVLFRELSLDKQFAKEISKFCVPCIKIITILMFGCGIISLFLDIGMSQNEIRYGTQPFQFLFSHPTYLVQNNIFIMILLYWEEKNKSEENSNIFFIIMLIITIFLSMRTKGIVVVAGFIYLRYGDKWLKKTKILYWGVAIIIILWAAMDKIQLYMSFTNSPRAAFYVGSLELIKKCFPIGSGFATYASHISGAYYSKVYNFIRIPIDWQSKTDIAYLGDAGFAYYLGQFGFLGVILLVICVYNMYKSFKTKLTKNWSLMLVVLNIGITLTTETLLCNNGVEFGIILAIVVSQIKVGQEMVSKRE